MISNAPGAFGDYDLDEESTLAMKAKKDRSIIPELWSRMYKLVVSACNNFWKQNGYVSKRCELDDLIQESYLFFENAIINYDPSRGTKFSTYLMIYIRTACRSASGGLTTKKQNDPIFHCESIDAPIKEGEDTTLGEMIPAEESETNFTEICESDAVKTILEQVEKVHGGMNRYCFLEYAYYGKSKTSIARNVRVSETAICKHIWNAAEQLRENPVIKSAYPERYERMMREQNSVADYLDKGIEAFFTTRSSIVEDIVNRKIGIENRRKWEKEHCSEKRKKE